MYSALVLISPARFSQVIPEDSAPDSKQRRTSHDLSGKPILVSTIPTSRKASSLKSLHLCAARGLLLPRWPLSD